MDNSKYNIQVDSVKKMELNEIKKALYKEKPTAIKYCIMGDPNPETNLLFDNTHCYMALLNDGEKIIFKVRESDMGDAKFEYTMPAHLLIRWIQL